MTPLDYAVELDKDKCIEVLLPYFENDNSYNKTNRNNISNISGFSNVGIGVGYIGGNQGFRTMKNSNSQASYGNKDLAPSTIYQNINNTSKNSNNSSINKIKEFANNDNAYPNSNNNLSNNKSFINNNNNSFINNNNNNNFQNKNNQAINTHTLFGTTKNDNYIQNINSHQINNNNDSINNTLCKNNNNFILGGNLDCYDNGEERKRLSQQKSDSDKFIKVKSKSNSNNPNSSTAVHETHGNPKFNNNHLYMNNTSSCLDKKIFKGGEEDNPNLMDTKYFEEKFLKMKNDIMQMSSIQDMKTNYGSNNNNNEPSLIANHNNVSYNNSIIKDQVNNTKINSHNIKHNNWNTNNQNINTNLHKKSKSIANDKLLAFRKINKYNEDNSLNNITAIKNNKETEKHAIKPITEESNKKRSEREQYNFNIEENRVVTLKEEFLDTYEKFESKDDSKMITPRNVIMNDDNFGYCILNKTKPGLTVVNDTKLFGENDKTNYYQIKERFVDYNSYLAVFVSSKNDIDYGIQEPNYQNNVEDLNFNYNEIYEQQQRYNELENSNEEILNLSGDIDGLNKQFENNKKNIKYFSKSNMGIKDEYKQISLALDTPIMKNGYVSNKKVNH